ncbi:non-homologous end joining protein Ku [Streptacidiphilus melanogenes]|uniref:non-homologous end joining protein Ku n=1 Tax=Streptacidiphilus melanogenes TaxID=411235 RepID=UPI0005AAAA2F|nr:Ku protein [Streptacidiphilus melanogenes]
MARPVWSGVLSFGLVSVPVQMFTATEDHTVHFHQLQRGTGDRVRMKRVNERTGKEVDYSDIVKGYEVQPGEYVIVEPEELDQISPSRSKTIDISGFVDLAAVEPVYFARTYWLGPKGEEYAKIYKLLAEALERSDRAGVAVFSMRGKEYLVALRAHDGLLALHTMHFPDEVRDPRKEIDTLPSGNMKVGDKELATAQQLIDMLATDWNPGEFRDTSEEQVRKLVKDKAAGREIVVSKGAPEEGTNVVDLMEALRASIERAGGTAAARPEKTAGTPKPETGKTSTSRRQAKKAPAAKKRTPAAGQEDLSGLTKQELYRRASDLDSAHRSTMTRDQLTHAIKKAGRKKSRAA